jgi:hypothetical protein
MKKHSIEDEELIALVKKSKIEVPTEDFTKRLTESVIGRYHKKKVPESIFGKYFGSFVIFFLICSNLFFLYDLNPFQAEPQFFMGVIAFVIGLWLLMVLMIRFRKPSLS